MQILTAHPVESTPHVWMWDAKYSQPVRVPVLRRVFGIVTRTVYVDILRNNANIVRPAWSVYYHIGFYTIAIVRKG